MISKLDCLCTVPYRKKEDIFLNIKHNFFFVVSAVAYFCLHFGNPKTWIVGFVIAVSLWSIIASQIKSVFEYSKQSNTFIKLISVISSLGTCWFSVIRFLERLQKHFPHFSQYEIIFKSIGFLGACAAMYFVYICTLLIFNFLNIKIAQLTKDLKNYEIVVYAFLIAIFIALSSFAFSQSQAFWGTDYSYDIIYTSDSPSLIKENVFLNLLHAENDLRQPLFSLFSFPFMGIPFLLGRIINASSSVQAILYNIMQVILMWASIFIISKMMNLTPLKRICFITTAFSTYTFLLFSLMMEQYIIAFFWLSLAMYSVSTIGKTGNFIFCGATGTLLSSAIVLPFVSLHYKQKKFKLWIYDMVKACLSFIALMLAFCRFDIIYNLISKIRQLIGYTGKAVPLSSKLYQFTAFVRYCFVAPDTSVNNQIYPSWQLIMPNKINLFGVIILLAILVSVIINRNKKSSLIAGAWSLYSIILLFIVGWGTQENGLILYALYFGWAFMTLLFQLIEKLEDKLKIRFLIPAFTVIAVALLLSINIPAINKLIHFAITYYPV